MENPHGIFIYHIPLNSLIDFDNFDSVYLRKHFYAELKIFPKLIYHKLLFGLQLDPICANKKKGEQTGFF